MERRTFLLGTGLGALSLACASCSTAAEPKERMYAEVESKLKPLAIPLAKPEPGDWLAEHKESGQTFAAYLKAKPVRKSSNQGTIYICLLGEFSPDQKKAVSYTHLTLPTSDLV